MKVFPPKAFFTALSTSFLIHFQETMYLYYYIPLRYNIPQVPTIHCEGPNKLKFPKFNLIFI